MEVSSRFALPSFQCLLGSQILINREESWVAFTALSELDYHLEWCLVIIVLPWGLSSKASACNAGDVGSIPGSGGSPGEGNGNPLQYYCLEKSQGQRGLVGYSPWDRKVWDMPEHARFYYQLASARGSYELCFILPWPTSGSRHHWLPHPSSCSSGHSPLLAHAYTVLLETFVIPTWKHSLGSSP